jgi:hypothetical protein
MWESGDPLIRGDFAAAIRDVARALDSQIFDLPSDDAFGVGKLVAEAFERLAERFE